MPSDELDYKLELERAYRALFAYAKAVATKKPLSEGACAYHALTIAAAVRFNLDTDMVGSGFFEGQNPEVLVNELRRLRT